MTGRHIRKENEGEWAYAEHEELRKICKLKKKLILIFRGGRER